MHPSPLRQFITRRIADWKKTPSPDLNRRPTVFLILAT